MRTQWQEDMNLHFFNVGLQYFKEDIYFSLFQAWKILHLG